MLGNVKYPTDSTPTVVVFQQRFVLLDSRLLI